MKYCYKGFIDPHQSKLLLESFKEIDTVREAIQWIDILFLILVVLFEISVGCNIFCKILTYPPFQHSILFWFWLVPHHSVRASRCFMV